MKTILFSLLMMMWTASELYGQRSSSSDSLYISHVQFFAIERMRRSYALIEIQYATLQQSSVQKNIKIAALKVQLVQNDLKIKSSTQYSKVLSQQLKAETRKNKLSKLAIPLVAISAFILGTL